jgi:4-alpha-glucanotransferase
VSLLLPDRVHFGRAICGDLDQAERREWWLANGRGGYASGTLAGSLSRRYHGLLVAPVNPPLGRVLVLAKADATLIDGAREWPLATNRWASGAVEPQGYVHIESFRLEGRMPVWRYACGELRLEQRIWMEPGAHTTYVAYRLDGVGPGAGAACSLRVRLLVNARDHHGNARPGAFDPVIEQDGECLRVTHPDWFRLHLRVPDGRLRTGHAWIENLDLPAERERGLDPTDCHLYVGEAVLSLAPGEWTGLVASLDEGASSDLEEAMRRFLAQDQRVLRRAWLRHPELREAPPWISQLVLASDSFVFARPLAELPDGESVIAGYPWFGDRGRDTMIALPGLTLATGRYESARRILETFARFVDQGMLPNAFPGAGEWPEYNSVDAALWYVEAWRAYLEVTRDRAALGRVYPVLESIIDWHRRGTRYGIDVDPGDRLLRAGEPGVQLTWMDAKVGDWVVTPRIGKPVEVNALWFNALMAMAGFARLLGRDASTYAEAADQVRGSLAQYSISSPACLDLRGGRRSGAPRLPAIPQDRRGAVRCHRRPRGSGPQCAPQPAVRREPGVQPAGTRGPGRGGGRVCPGAARLLRAALPEPGPSGLSALLPGRDLGARRQLSPGTALGLAARAIRAGAASPPGRSRGGPGVAGAHR